MPDAAEQLRRVLELERARGYPNTTVIGGVDRLLRSLLLDGALAPGTPAHEALASLPAHGYGSLPVDARARWSERVLRDLSRTRSAERGTRNPQTRNAERGTRSGDGGALSDERETAPVSAPRGRNRVNGSAGIAAVSNGRAHGPAGDETTAAAASGSRTVQAKRRAAPTITDGGGAMAPGGTATAPQRAAPVPRSALRAPRSKGPHSLGLAAPVTVLSGVSTVTAGKLEKLGIRTVRDVLWHLPHRYDDFSKVRPVAELILGDVQTVVGTVWSAAETNVGRFRRGTEAVIGDHTGNVRVIWFNQPWLVRQLHTNDRVALSGKMTVFRGVRQMESPEWEVLEGDLSDAVHTGRLLPVYPLTAGISARTLRRLVRDTLDTYLPLVEDPLPEEVRHGHGFPTLAEALRQIHYPDDAEQAGLARRRLAFDELLTLQLAVLRRRAERRGGGDAPALPMPDGLLDAFHAALPFALTDAQRRVTDQILSDIAGTRAMSRLVQGDVGSGKTVVAAAALLAAAANGLQSALMAPTEILAEQHFRTLCRLFGGDPDEGPIAVCRPPFLDRPLRIALLSGGMRARARREVQMALAEGWVDVAVGTHALIQADVTLPRLGLAVVDEQHRFGVAQRAALRGASGPDAEAGDAPAHLLVMTATPIPRTLALTLYGDLDVSLIDEMPPGREPVKTLVVQSHERDAAYNFIIEQLRAGRQAFVICPLVEESEKESMVEVKAATAEYERLREVFTSASLALLHGRMPPAKKDEVMREFRDQLHDVLVSTAVVEVGIDVPNATVMMVEGADRFGLAQLHQFRGRVGRGEHQSYCFLMADGVSEEARERLQLMEDIADGFQLAEEDLRLRGPGEYFGTRQSGLPELKVAGLADTRLLEQARAAADAAVGENASLAGTPFAAYAADVERLLAGAGADVS